MTRRAGAAGLAVLLAGLAGAALAGERAHAVRPGESVSAIAKHYYGNHELADLLLRYNGRQSTMIRPGEELRVPFCDVHRVRPGDSWSVLAQRYMGRASAWEVVAELNGEAPEKPLRAGQELVFPVVIEHRMERGESLGALAERFLGDARRAGLLQRFNDLGDPRRLAVGERVRVPVLSLRLVAGAAATAAPRAQAPPPEPAPAQAGPPPGKPGEDEAESRARPSEASPSPDPVPPPEPAPRFAQELDEAAGAWRAGEYGRARALLESLRAPVTERGAVQDRRELARLLAFVYVAFDQPEQACAAFGALSPDASASFDPDLVSPKIRSALEACPSD